MKPELLSPAGDKEALNAALTGGADAVYLGGPRFSARAYATNFTDEDLAESVRQCHRLGVKIYITINTLLKDSEILDAYEYAVSVWNMGVDAIIIQDPGLILLLNHFHPEIELHASTQMTVHNLKGADLISEKGITRLVLARELTLDEITEISQQHETEVFIHGALCISYSGKCLMSSMLGGRSGNRGRCAQNCRMEYQLLDRSGAVEASGYLMSPKDLSTLDLTQELIKTGTRSLKIEGRMKRPEYVFETVHQYRKALANETWDHTGITQLFNREGFNHAFLLGNDGKDMMAYQSPRNTGVVLGRVRDGKVKLQTSLSLGDGIKAGDSGFIVTKLKEKGQEVRSAKVGAIVEIYPNHYSNGDLLVKTSDAALMADIQSKLKQKRQGNLPIRLKASFEPGKPLELEVSFKGQMIKGTGDLVEESIQRPLSEDRLKENLMKTGGTPFIVEELELDYKPGFLRMSAVNEIRRDLLNQLETILLKTPTLEVKSRKQVTDYLNQQLAAKQERAIDLPPYLVLVSRQEQLKAFYDVTSQKIETNINDKNENSTNQDTKKNILPVLYLWHRQAGSLTLKDAKALDEAGKDYWLRLPEILKSEFNEVIQSLKGLKHMKGIITDNYGVIEEFKDSGLKLVGDYKLNLMNSYAPLLFPELSGYTVSEELNYTELSELKTQSAYLILYGRTELMHSEYCPIGSTVGGLSKNTPCSIPCQRMDYTLKDRTGEEFPILTDYFCRSYIMNSKTKNNLDQQDILKDLGFNHFRIDLTTENEEESRTVISALLSKEGLYIKDHTRGHYKRGVD